MDDNAKDPSEKSVGQDSTKDIEKDKKLRQTKKKSNRKNYENCRRCWGFCDFLRTSWKTFKEFSADTSIHGIKYLTDPKRHWSEKLFWAIALTLSIAACSFLIYDTYRRWQDAPVIVSFSEKFMNIWEIPFAAVTICPIAGLHPLNEKYNISDFQKEFPLKNFTRTISKRITHVSWKSTERRSSDLFTEIATEEGFCWTFNMMSFEDIFREDVAFEAFDNLRNKSRVPDTNWDLQEGYYNKNPKAYPYRASGSGEDAGLKFEIWRQIEEVRNSPSFVKGFKLVVHLPCEVPHFENYYRFPLEKSATLVIRPSLIVTENLNGVDPKIRQCYFEEDRTLMLFKKYSRANCHVECLAEFTRKHCGCVHYSMPRLKGDAVCDSGKAQCCIEARKKLMKDNMESSLGSSTSYDDRGTLVCDCLPACTSLNYEGEISHDDLRYFGKYKNNEAFRSAVSIFFKDDDFIFSKRSELFTYTDFIANFGGILGLFLGVSILSIVEIIYFIAFRKLDDATECGSRRGSAGDDTTIASVEIKADDVIVRNGF